MNRTRSKETWGQWVWKWLVAGFWALLGDARSAVVGGGAGALVGLVISWWFAANLLEHEVHVNEDGWAQPRSLFERVEKLDPTLQLDFRPPSLKQTFVCEYKLSRGETWRLVVLSYLDAYRECFDVTRRGESSYVISPNMRSSQMEFSQGAYMCKCQTAK